MLPWSSLWTIAEHFPGVDALIRSGDPLPSVDYIAHLLGLPRAFGTNLDSIPASVPYIAPPLERVAHWSAKLGKARLRRVGLVWGGNPSHKRDRYRSIPAPLLAPLLQVPGFEFIGLQKGDAIAAAASSAVYLGVGEALDDWCDTAAVLSHLDLVIGVDTAVVHLAGALGKEVWTLLPQPPDFRWLENRDDTPWYPTMRLFRQQVRGDWDAVIRRVAAALIDYQACKGPMREAKASLPVVLPALARLPHVPGRLQGFAAVAETRGGIVEYLPSREPVGSALRWYGEHLQAQVDLLDDLGLAGTTVVEVAAGVGEHALLLSAAIGAAGHLYLYEADALLHPMLRQNLRANGIVNTTLMRRELGGGVRALPAEDARDPSATKQLGYDPAKVDSLDDLQLEQLQLLKVNAPALVDSVLDGAQDSLWRLRPKLFLSVDEVGGLEPLVRRLQGFGYRCWRVESPLFNVANFNRRGDDVYQGQTALALLAVPEECDASISHEDCVELT